MALGFFPGRRAWKCWIRHENCFEELIQLFGLERLEIRFERNVIKLIAQRQVPTSLSPKVVDSTR
jgi:hypothetical protein